MLSRDKLLSEDEKRIALENLTIFVESRQSFRGDGFKVVLIIVEELDQSLVAESQKFSHPSVDEKNNLESNFAIYD